LNSWNGNRSTAIRLTELLYGLAEQRDSLARGLTPVIVEGPLDVVALRGVHADLVPVAPSGTALTRQHVQQLRNVSGARRVVVAFDNDQPGRNAAVRAYPFLQGTFSTVDWLSWPEGSDLAELATPHLQDVEAATQETTR
jgi:DNA primase